MTPSDRATAVCPRIHLCFERPAEHRRVAAGGRPRRGLAVGGHSARLAGHNPEPPPHYRRGSTRRSFPAPEGGLLDLDNFRRREFGRCRRGVGQRDTAPIYDLRSTFACNALAAGVTGFELAPVMGRSVRRIERHHGPLLDGPHNVIAGRLDAFAAGLEQAGELSRLSPIPVHERTRPARGEVIGERVASAA